ncbi:MAG TPA: hypothetical protein DIU11_05405 [Pusillimonas sp.]|nr:hypothetical protein [Pusillimonas sp.]
MAFHQELNIALILRNSVSLRHWFASFEWPVLAWQAHFVAVVSLATVSAMIFGVCSLLADHGVRNLLVQSVGARLPQANRQRHCALALVLGAFLGIWVGGRYGVSAYSVFLLVAVSMLFMLAMIDAHTGLLPDVLTLPLLWLGLALAWSGILPVSLHQSVGGAIAGYGFLWLLSVTFFLVRGQEGMGYGDFKLTAALGAWLGYGVLPLVLLLACILGLVAVCAYRFLQRIRGSDIVAESGPVLAQTLPFGPYLVVSGVAVLLVS